jgi:hypothetical protein
MEDNWTSGERGVNQGEQRTAAFHAKQRLLAVPISRLVRAISRSASLPLLGASLRHDFQRTDSWGRRFWERGLGNRKPRFPGLEWAGGTRTYDLRIMRPSATGYSRRQRTTVRHVRPPPITDILDWKASLLPCGEAARDLCRPVAQGRLRAYGVLAEVDGGGALRICDVLGKRDRSRPRRGSVPTTLDPGPQIENLREADLDRAPRRLGLHEVESRSVPAHREGR